MSIFNKLRSPFKLLWIIVRESAGTVWALLRGNIRTAGMRIRFLAENIHEDILKFLLVLQRLVPFWGRPGEGIKRVLIIKLDRIGDMVNTTPVFDTLRTLFPEAKLDIIAHPGPLSLLEGDHRIGERIPYRSWLYHPLAILPPGLGAWMLVLKLLFRRYPLVVYLRGSFPFLFLGLTSRLVGAKFVPGEPVVTRYFKALEALYGPLPRRRPSLVVQPEASRNAENLFARDTESSGPRIVIHASASTATKTWPPERFATLADRLAGSINARIHFLGSLDDQPLLAKIKGLSGFNHSFHTSLRLPQVVALIDACDLFIGNDSGLSHIAAAVGRPLVILWGPANLSMARPETPVNGCTLLYHNLPCRTTCPEFRCTNPVNLECLYRIQVSDVVEAVSHLLPPRQSEKPLPSHPARVSLDLVHEEGEMATSGLG